MNADLADLTSQRNEYENSKTYLNELLARNIDTKFEIHDSIPLSDTLRLDSIRALMNIGNTRLKVSEEDIRIARQEMRSSRAQQIPFIDFIAGYNYFRNETEAGFIKYNRYFGPGVGISAGVTLFDGLNLQRQVRNARIVCMNSQLEHDRLKLDLDAYLIRIYNDYRNQLDLVGFELENMTLAERNMDLAKESFSVGAISSLDLREIQKNLLEARERYLTTRFRTKVKETELLLISGQLVR
jgi:outer membrane protein TolC